MCKKGLVRSAADPATSTSLPTEAHDHHANDNVKGSDRHDGDRGATPGAMRLKQIIAPNGVFPVSKSDWYAGIAKGIYPPSRKFGRKAMWYEADVRRLIETGDWREKPLQ